MFRTLHNQARLILRVQPVSPLLVKSSGAGIDPSRPEIDFVTVHSSEGPVEYLPGSSLKGVLRAFAERLLLALGKHVCDPIEKKSPCTERERRSYGRQCFACKLFGSPLLAGRLRVVDGLPWPTGADAEGRKAGQASLRRELRVSSAIDRATGASSARGFFELEVLTGGTLYPEIHLRNFELWQLSLIGLALDELNAGYSKIGSGKSRGMGTVSCTIESLEVRQYGPLAQADALCGIGAAPGVDRKSDRLTDLDRCPWPAGVTASAGPISTARLEGPAIEGLFASLLTGPAWSHFVGAPV